MGGLSAIEDIRLRQIPHYKIFDDIERFTSLSFNFFYDNNSLVAITSWFFCDIFCDQFLSSETFFNDYRNRKSETRLNFK